MIRVDAEGIPKIVQSIRYEGMGYYIKLFTGQSVLIDCDQLIPINQHYLSDEAFQDVEDAFLSTQWPHITHKLKDQPTSGESHQ